MKILYITLVFCLGLSGSYGTTCADISGSWQNELGSRMLLKVIDVNRLAGEYYTAVEAESGAAAFVSNITGFVSSQSDGTVLAFSVIFNHGSSLTTWVGQCTVCNGKEVLHTTYTFCIYSPEYHKKWSTVIVNQNTFHRLDEETENELETYVSTAYSPVKVHSVVSDKLPGGLEISGKWRSNNKEEIDIFNDDGKVLKGKHHSIDLIGRSDGNDTFTAVTLMLAGNKKIRSWTGYIYDSSSSMPKVLETTWLEHEFNPSCIEARNAVRIGKQNFTRVASDAGNNLKKSETFLDKIRKFFSSMF